MAEIVNGYTPESVSKARSVFGIPDESTLLHILALGDTDMGVQGLSEHREEKLIPNLPNLQQYLTEIE